MSPAILALIFGLFGLAAAFGIWRSLRTGVTGTGFGAADIDETPIRYSFVIAGKALAVGYGAASVLFAFGLVGDPHVRLRTALQKLPLIIHGATAAPRQGGRAKG